MPRNLLDATYALTLCLGLLWATPGSAAPPMSRAWSR